MLTLKLPWRYRLLEPYDVVLVVDRGARGYGEVELLTETNLAHQDRGGFELVARLRPTNLRLPVVRVDLTDPEVQVVPPPYLTWATYGDTERVLRVSPPSVYAQLINWLRWEAGQAPALDERGWPLRDGLEPEPEEGC